MINFSSRIDFYFKKDLAMKKILILLFSIMILPLSSFANWTFIITGTSGGDYYIDYQIIKKNNNYE